MDFILAIETYKIISSKKMLSSEKTEDFAFDVVKVHKRHEKITVGARKHHRIQIALQHLYL